MKKYAVLCALVGCVAAFLLFGVIDDSFAQNLSDSKKAPLKQFDAGIMANNVLCRANLELLIKSNGNPICVTQETKAKLIYRLGWAAPSKGDHQPEKIEKFPYPFDKEMFTNSTSTDVQNGLIKFSSHEEVVEFLKQAQNSQSNYVRHEESFGFPTGDGLPVPLTPRPPPEPRPEPEAESPPGSKSPIPAGQHVGNDGRDDYSTTNVQVTDVDEPDYLKTDGKYIYIVNQNTLTIIDAYPAENAKILHKIALDIEPQNIENMFLKDDRLALIYQGSQIPPSTAIDVAVPYPVFTSSTALSILDVTDRQNPQVLSMHNIDGYYHNSRMIENMIYLITNSNVDYGYPLIPRIFSESGIMYPDVYRFPNPEDYYNFNTVSAIDLSSNKLVNSETFLMGHSNTIYVSEDNLYVTYEKNITPKQYEQIQRDRFFDVILPYLSSDVQKQIKMIDADSSLDLRQKWREVSDILQEAYNAMPKQQRDDIFGKIDDALKEYDNRVQYDTRATSIHKIALDDGNFKYLANSQVPGFLLNQFSMDEHNGKFRLATTSEGHTGREQVLSSNVYVLDESLKVLGKLEKIAPEERIFSARFMGDKLYLVTFKQIDPFFVIDLSSNTPKILGELKIPGVSNYLQAYDENHIIGIGRDTIESKGRVQTNGIKISMFDVTDFKNPKESDTIVIGDSGTDSEILYNHKALLLDKRKNVMSIPIKTSMDSLNPADKRIAPNYDKRWHGFYVYGFDEKGFVENGTITHYQWQYSYNAPYMQSRSFYIGDVLYTVMDGSIKMNNINDVSNEINSIILARSGHIIPFVGTAE